jgi:hypothetical protein
MLLLGDKLGRGLGRKRKVLINLSGKIADYLPTVCHERTKEFYTPKCGAAQEMRVGPSESTFRSRFQTTLSCAGKEPGW